ncbi:glucose-6-phosphate isomerase [Psychrosphaera sp. B3R10]|uniref:glucose-6-phosphate isomerase n=1 Tax=unclassified Psychrosphaera TaxID=2641570 RepID=UPI001C09522D|nr:MULTISPECIES: glucose-6-phosphate isomerase [unclassified Psychrosphaera]MBU2882983.1 glucose-6-phosphate isomerase [Psychrosphaera sp. I2R16]MBU2991380.1 glucose-6-phosphate isomerase [Psychrosphaera sp. B3R10]MDO6720269.1 glucose-6-phosphate isomerase [Psychrosphaera sp. 1_MG-2023]
MSNQAWQNVEQEYNRMKPSHMRDLFAADQNRAATFTTKACGFTLDYSKNRIDQQSLNALLSLARDSGVESKRDAMFAGEVINLSEQRAVLHTALRRAKGDSVLVDGENVVDEVHATLAKIKQFVAEVHNGTRQGYTGKTFTDVVAIGIGGSFLGPKIVTEALKPYQQKAIKVHFVANVDGHHITDVLAKLNAETTLIVMSSKSFTTQETLQNTLTTREWFLASGAKFTDIAKHFMCVSSNIAKATEFGIAEENIFPMWDWVGGRYSLWSAIGLPIALAVGYDNFSAVLDGARDMDDHFQNTPLAENLPVILGVLGVWYSNFFGCQSHVLLPYSHYLRGFPAYVQQLDMESNGKRTSHEDEEIEYSTGPIIWGGEGTNGQHAFHQLMHQGNTVVPADFILPVKPAHDEIEHHQMLASNCFAQTQALMQGETREEIKAALLAKGVDADEAEKLAKHKFMPGNRPSNTLLMDELSPKQLGSLIALYEHKVFVQGVIWNINSFDQWGVELGKVLGNRVLDALQDKAQPELDSSTQQLVDMFRAVIK